MRRRKERLEQQDASNGVESLLPDYDPRQDNVLGFTDLLEIQREKGFQVRQKFCYVGIVLSSGG